MNFRGEDEKESRSILNELGRRFIRLNSSCGRVPSKIVAGFGASCDNLRANAGLSLGHTVAQKAFDGLVQLKDGREGFMGRCGIDFRPEQVQGGCQGRRS
jgi:hypothetical protein